MSKSKQKDGEDVKLKSMSRHLMKSRDGVPEIYYRLHYKSGCHFLVQVISERKLLASIDNDPHLKSVWSSSFGGRE